MLWSLLIGFIIGAIAKFIMPGKDPGGILVTIFLGIAGSALANWIGINTGIYVAGEGGGLISSILGALIILFIYRMIFRRS